MNSEFENQLQRQPMREVPPHWRARILAGAQPAPIRWHEWLSPAPQAWAVLGAAWILIFVLHFSTPEEPHPTGVYYAGGPQSFASLQEQSLMMAQLLGPSENDTKLDALPAPPKPRSERERRQLFG